MAKTNTASLRDTNLALINTIPEEAQRQLYLYLTENYCKDDFFPKPKTASEILDELSESRMQSNRGEVKDFDAALDDISTKYGL